MIDGDNLRTAKKGAAVLVTVLVQTLDTRLPGFQDAFLQRLSAAYAEIRHDDFALDGLELIKWTQTLLTGFDGITGQGDPFLEGR
jgi:hypothetical protein